MWIWIWDILTNDERNTDKIKTGNISVSDKVSVTKQGNYKFLAEAFENEFIDHLWST